MSDKIRIAPSILAADFTQLGQQIRDAQAAGAECIHIDVMDGRFVPNMSMGPLVVEAARRSTDLPLDVHLMIVEPDHLLDLFAKAGASTIHVHWETGFHLNRTLTHIRELGCDVGIAINPHTPVAVLSEVLPLVDKVLVMTVNPGYGGQEMIPQTLHKVTQLREIIDSQKLAIDVMVDGGVNEATIGEVVDAGADLLVVGSGFFNSKFTPAQGMERLHTALEKHRTNQGQLTAR
ncbi:MAG: ribulose-phosphate 3-epimerase [Anaerolineae bacterium]|nr:ribulose-phosphate 3-epimerase [Anaerolineae bacterium]